MKLNAQELREVPEEEIQEKLKTIKRHPIYFILENIYDTYNVGGLFRLADAIGVSKMYLCGSMEIPPNSRIKKASIGTYKVVPWEYRKSAAEAIADLRENRLSTIDYRKSKVDDLKSVKIVAIEQSTHAIPYINADYTLPVALLVGNETSGVTKETLELCDQIVEIPMWGINKSLNVIVSAAIVSYHVMMKES